MLNTKLINVFILGLRGFVNKVSAIYNNNNNNNNFKCQRAGFIQVSLEK